MFEIISFIAYMLDLLLSEVFRLTHFSLLYVACCKYALSHVLVACRQQ